MRRVQFPDKRFLGDTRYMLVHDLDAETNLCGINSIIEAGTGHTFEPDNLNQATEEDYETCESCTGE